VGVASVPHGMDAGTARGGMGMTDARFERSRAVDATGNARPDDEPIPSRFTRDGGGSAPNRSAVPGSAPAQDWTRLARDPSDTSLLLHWIDEKGSVVRLLTSTSDADAPISDA
jgi:hypothetical protein